MLNLKNSLLLTTFLFLSCVTKAPFEISSTHNQKSSEDFHVIKVSANHIKQECVFLDAEDENKWRHQYTMYILNDQDEVIEVLHAINQDISTCKSQVKEVSKILKPSPVVTLCLRGKLEKDLTNSEFQVFEHSKKYPVRFSFLTFDTVCNTKDCFSVNEARKYTCPGFVKH